MRTPALVLLAALVATTVGGAPAARAERTYSAAEVREILDIIDTHVERRRAAAARKDAAAAEKERVRTAKLIAALSLGAAIKADRADRKAKQRKAKQARKDRRDRLLFLLTGGRSGTGAPVRRGR